MGVVFGWSAVAVLAILAFTGVQVWSNTASDDWHDERWAVSKKNLDITTANLALPAALEQPQIAEPDKPFIVAHPNVAAIGAALGVAVVGSILVLLATIAARLPDRRT